MVADGTSSHCYSKIVQCSAPQTEFDFPNIHSSLKNIAVVAPHPGSPNGIGDYSGRLIEEFRLQIPGCSIISPVDFLSQAHKSGDWRGRELPPYWSSNFLETIDAAHPQLVHIQHGMYIGYGRELDRFLAGLYDRHIPCIVTLHGVWPSTPLRRWPVRFYHVLEENAVHVIVHQRAGTLSLLQEHGIPANRISIIPHGTWTNEEIAAIKKTKKTETTDMIGRRIVIFAGNIFRRKGLHIVIQAFPAVVKKIPEACLLVVGKERTNNFLDRLYRFCLHIIMRQGLKEGWLIYRPEYVPDEELWSQITSAEVAVFPYIRQYGAASGVFHRVLAVGLPAMCSKVPTFAEAFDAWGESLDELFPPPGDASAWSRSLIRILTDEHFRGRAMEASSNLGRETSWPLVARQHLELYKSLIIPN